MQTALLALPGGAVGRPFTKSQDAAATAQNTFTLPARANARWVILSVVITMLQVTVVNGSFTISNIADDTGAAGTVTFRVVDSAAGGALLALNFPYGLWAAGDNLAVVVNLPAIGSGGASSVAVSGLLVS